MIRRPPRSTLFPYTTLSDLGRCLQPAASQLPVSQPLGERDDRRWYCCRAVDRKSTRLNSSHSQISYAVFCLKKKNTEFNSLLLTGYLQQVYVRLSSHDSDDM